MPNDRIPPTSRADKPLCLGILGMHRSGTSALTGLLGQVGVELGSSMRKPHPGVNEKGYWEHLDVVLAHDRMLETIGTSWDDPRPMPERWWESPVVAPFRAELEAIVQRDFAGKKLWGIKDPRMCRLLPMWKPILAQARFSPRWILTIRHPAEVAGSLTKRDGFHPEKSGLIWLQCQLECERETRGDARVFTQFDRVLAEPAHTLENISTALAMQYPIRLDDALPKIREFITPGLRHHQAREGALDEFGPWADVMGRTLAAWNDAAENGETEAFRAELDDVRRELAERQAAFSPALNSHLDVLYARLAEARGLMEDVRSAPSWHLTKPLRLLERTSARVAKTLKSEDD